MSRNPDDVALLSSEIRWSGRNKGGERGLVLGTNNMVVDI